MRVQYNSKTFMNWNYLPTKIARILGLKKGDDVEYIHDEKTNKVEFKKISSDEIK